MLQGTSPITVIMQDTWQHWNDVRKYLAEFYKVASQQFSIDDCQTYK